MVIDGEEKRLMELVHVQTTMGGQHTNVVKSRIGLVKQLSRNMIGKVKGEKFQPLNFTQSYYIPTTAIYEMNCIPILKSDKYVLLTPSQIVNQQYR